MTFSRTTTNKLRFILDQLLPPILRDSRAVMFLPMVLAFRHEAKLVMDFKKRAPFLTDEEIEDVYQRIQWYSDQRDTDLNSECIELIGKSAIGKTVLDVGCGRGLLADTLSRKQFSVTGVDIVIDEALQKRFPAVRFVKAAMEQMPFRDREFDTVVCTHTLEHVKDINPAIHELRRVAKKRLILVVPRQRPYRYTFDLHLQFFPYAYTFQQAIRSTKHSSCEEVGGDLFYIEDLDKGDMHVDRK